MSRDELAAYLRAEYGRLLGILWTVSHDSSFEVDGHGRMAALRSDLEDLWFHDSERPSGGVYAEDSRDPEDEVRAFVLDPVATRAEKLRACGLRFGSEAEADFFLRELWEGLFCDLGRRLGLPVPGFPLDPGPG